jgi:leader peptidase (prepilin peptidase)/N-methyltransferase
VHNVPVIGWIVLGGRCKDCREPISLQYPAMEASFGALAWLVVAHFGVHAESLCYLGLFLVLLLISWVDWDTMHIFDVTTAPLALAGMTMSWIFPGHFLSPYDSALASVAMLALMLVISQLGGLWYGREVVGDGDLKLMAAGAAFLGCRQAWKALALGVLVALPILIVYVRLKGLGRKDPAPFGPGLALGIAVVAWNMMSNGELDSAWGSLGLSMLKAN